MWLQGAPGSDGPAEGRKRRSGGHGPTQAGPSPAAPRSAPVDEAPSRATGSGPGTARWPPTLGLDRGTRHGAGQQARTHPARPPLARRPQSQAPRVVPSCRQGPGHPSGHRGGQLPWGQQRLGHRSERLRGRRESQGRARLPGRRAGMRAPGPPSPPARPPDCKRAANEMPRCGAARGHAGIGAHTQTAPRRPTPAPEVAPHAGAPGPRGAGTPAKAPEAQAGRAHATARSPAPAGCARAWRQGAGPGRGPWVSRVRTPGRAAGVAGPGPGVRGPSVAPLCVTCAGGCGGGGGRASRRAGRA